MVNEYLMIRMVAASRQIAWTLQSDPAVARKSADNSEGTFPRDLDSRIRVSTWTCRITGQDLES